MGPARMRFKLSSKRAQPGAAGPHAPGCKETDSIAGDFSVLQNRRTASQACSKDSTPADCGVVDIADHFSALESTAEGGWATIIRNLVYLRRFFRRSRGRLRSIIVCGRLRLAGLCHTIFGDATSLNSVRGRFQQSIPV